MVLRTLAANRNGHGMQFREPIRISALTNREKIYAFPSEPETCFCGENGIGVFYIPVFCLANGNTVLRKQNSSLLPAACYFSIYDSLSNAYIVPTASFAQKSSSIAVVDSGIAINSGPELGAHFYG